MYYCRQTRFYTRNHTQYSVLTWPVRTYARFQIPIFRSKFDLSSSSKYMSRDHPLSSRSSSSCHDYNSTQTICPTVYKHRIHPVIDQQ